MKRQQIGIIGLGKFGLKLGKSLIMLGHTVVGVDIVPEHVKKAQQILSQVYEADATSKDALQQLGFAEMANVIVSVGSSIAASAMITMYLKEFEGPRVWVKSVSTDHENLLRRIGADEVVLPEYVAAKQIAYKITNPQFIDQLPFDKTLVIQELNVDNWAGKSLRELDLTNRYEIQVIAIKKGGADEYTFIPKADDKLNKDDNIVVIGKVKQLHTIHS